MGRRDRERRERIQAGLEEPIAPHRTVTEEDRNRIHKVGYSVLRAMNTSNQVKVLRESLRLNKLSPDRLRKALEDNAGREMQKGANKLRKRSKPVTVDALLEKYHKDVGFQELAAEVGLDEAWFTALAEKECGDKV